MPGLAPAGVTFVPLTPKVVSAVLLAWLGGEPSAVRDRFLECVLPVSRG